MGEYKESVFEFMNGVWGVYGEWLYYEGRKVYLGKGERENREKIVYEMDLEEVGVVGNVVGGKWGR